MKRNGEQISAFSETVLNEVAVLRAWGQANQHGSSARITHGFFRRYAYSSSGFLLGFNPLAPVQDGEIGAAVEASAAAWITLGSINRWNLWNSESTNTPETLSIKFCDPVAEGKAGTMPRINFQLNLDYRFSDDRLQIVSKLISPRKVMDAPSEFLLDTIDYIKRASRVEEISVPPNNESVQK